MQLNMFLKSSSTLVFFILLSTKVLLSQPKVELLSSSQARPGYGAGFKIKIARNGATGLMRFVSNIPKECTVNELKINSAMLSSTENELRAVWLSVPLRDTIFQEWELKIPENAKGKYVIGGKLEYFVDGEKKSVSSNTVEIYLTPFFTRYLNE